MSDIWLLNNETENSMTATPVATYNLGTEIADVMD
jgi:hypothetical protein